MTLQFQKFTPPNLEAVASGSILVENLPGQRFVPPSLVPEPEREKSSAPAAPVAPTYSETDLKQAEQAGHRQGFLEGEREGRAQAEAAQSQVEQALAIAVENMAGQLQQAISHYNAFAAAQQAELPRLALAIARKVAGEALSENALSTIEAVTLSCLARLVGEPNIAITVAESLAPALEERLTAHFANNQDPGEINIHGDPSLAPGDCRIEWASGSATRSTKALWEEVESIVAEMVSASEAEAEAEPEQPESPQPE